MTALALLGLIALFAAVTLRQRHRHNRVAGQLRAEAATLEARLARSDADAERAWQTAWRLGRAAGRSERGPIPLGDLGRHAAKRRNGDT